MDEPSKTSTAANTKLLNLLRAQRSRAPALRTGFTREKLKSFFFFFLKYENVLVCLVTLCSHCDDGLGSCVLLVFHPRVVLVQQLRQRRRFGEQLADHVAADVGRLLQTQDAEDLRLDAVEPHQLAVLPEVAGRALLSALPEQLGSLVHLHGETRRGEEEEEDGQAEREEHAGEKSAQ